MKIAVEAKWKTLLIKVFFTLFVFLFIAVYVTQYVVWDLSPNPTVVYPKLDELPVEKSSLTNPEYVVYTSGCRIPTLNPFDSKIRKYINAGPKIDCRKNKLELTTADQSSIKANKTSIKSLELSCCYNALYRVSDNVAKYSTSADNKFKFNSTCWPIREETTPVSDEFVRVICLYKNGTKAYTNFHAFVPRKPSVEERCSNQKVAEITKRQKPSVMILGLDAVSRINLQRQMPGTYEFLTRGLGAIELFGYNKVADNTFPNMVTVTSGYFEKELGFCWPSKSAKFDDCPWIWKSFSNQGYRTVFGEDAPWMGIWTYLRTGFVEQPTDYYLRPYMMASEKEIGWNHDLNSNLCQGPRLTLEVMLDYARQVALNFAQDLYFTLLWTVSLSHDYLNYPKFGDKYWLDYFTEMNASSAFNNTVLIVMSDHGMRFGSIRETYQGKLEERQPFVLSVFPDWFQKEFPTAVRNFNHNRHYLTTPFDLHEMLKDLADLASLEEKNIASRTAELNRVIRAGNPPRAVSLFLPIYGKRTCTEAGIEDHWCTCVPSEPVDLKSSFVISAASAIIRNLTETLDKYKQCAKLNLQSIDSARMQNKNKHFLKKVKSQEVDYTVMLTTSPGGAKFEATMKYSEDRTDALSTPDEFVITGTISRINLYGNQSWCVDDYQIKKYCFCP